MKKHKIIICIMSVALIIGTFSACTKKNNYLDPDNPITISVWHYYNGTVKNRFDSLVNDFNETIGMEQGVVVDAQSYGDVNELADAVYNAASKNIGAQEVPDIFAAYPDNAFRVNKIIELVDIEAYFSDEELGEIRSEFLDEGRFGKEQILKILPIAKSTENFYLNKTYWDKFAEETGADINDLSTWEGIIKTAELYYNNTGNSFFCIDANANFMLITSKQLGEEFYTYNGNDVELNFSEENAYKIWEGFYVPYIRGYFAKTGRFSSDDAKTGNILAYTGSTAGASYFPTEITDDGKSVAIEVLTLPYPCFENGELYAVQQGAGMCIAKSDKAHEYGASLFLKWFIDEPQNVKFAVTTAYFPVKKAALNEETLLNEVNEAEVSIEAIKKSIKTTMQMFENYSLYGNRPFEGSYEMRSLLENHLFNRVQEDLMLLNERVSGGEERIKVIDELISKEKFLEWYQQFKEEASQILSK
jgi:multiple sugar transport system substrate-binding protein